MSTDMSLSFEHVLLDFKHMPPGKSGFWRRRDWKPRAFIFLVECSKMESFIAVCTSEGRCAPWTPSRCDLFENDWERFA